MRGFQLYLCVYMCLWESFLPIYNVKDDVFVLKETYKISPVSPEFRRICELRNKPNNWFAIYDVPFIIVSLLSGLFAQKALFNTFTCLGPIGVEIWPIDPHRSTHIGQSSVTHISYRLTQKSNTWWKQFSWYPTTSQKFIQIVMVTVLIWHGMTLVICECSLVTIY